MPYSTTRGDPNDPDTTVLRALWKRKEDVIADDIKREKAKFGVIPNRLSLYSMYICNDEMISEPQRLTATPHRPSSASPSNSSRSITSSPIQTPERKLRKSTKNSLRFSDENVDTLRWSDDSPKRGRIRPSTAPNSITNSNDSFFDIFDHVDENNNHDNIDNGYENEYSDDNLNTDDKDYENLKKLLFQRKKLMGLTINTADKTKYKFKASPSPIASPSPTYTKDGTKKVNYPNVSTKFLRKQSQMKQLQDRALDAIIFQEARLFQQRVTECIKEANLFSEVLGKSTRYKVVARDPKEDAYWDKIVKSNKEKKFPDELLPAGTARRLNKMMVQIRDDDSNTNRLINIDKFFMEHSELHMDMKLHGSLIPSNEISQFSISNSDKKRSKNQASMMKSQSIISESLPEFGGTNGKINFTESSTNKKETQSRSRKDVLNDLKEVTDMIVVNVKTLDRQLNEFKIRGWNLGI
jgi:hypothetical protein